MHRYREKTQKKAPLNTNALDGGGLQIQRWREDIQLQGYQPSALGWRSLHQASGLEPGAGVPWVGGGMSMFKVSMFLGLLREHGLHPLFQFWPGSSSPEPPSADACPPGRGAETPPGRGQRPPRLPAEASSSPRPSCSQEQREMASYLCVLHEDSSLPRQGHCHPQLVWIKTHIPRSFWSPERPPVGLESPH